MGLLERGTQGLGFGAVLFLEVADLAGQRLDDRVVAVAAAGRGRLRAGLGAQVLDPGPQVGVSVEEGVGDAGFALHGLEGDGLAALDQSADRLVSSVGFRLTLAEESDPAPPDVVLVGGAGPEFSYQALNRAFGHLQRGARLVAMHRGLYWRTSEGLQLDTGAFLAGLEQAAGTEAEVVGKPAAAFFATALAHLGVGAADTLMVGDDIEADVLAAQRQGLTGVLVKTGKYLPRAHRAASGMPDHVLDSFADLPALLEQLS